MKNVRLRIFFTMDSLPYSFKTTEPRTAEQSPGLGCETHTCAKSAHVLTF